MGILIEVKVVAVAGSLRMTIPSPVVRTLKIRAGDTVIVDLNGDIMTVRKKTAD